MEQESRLGLCWAERERDEGVDCSIQGTYSHMWAKINGSMAPTRNNCSLLRLSHIQSLKRSDLCMQMVAVMSTACTINFMCD